MYFFCHIQHLHYRFEVLFTTKTIFQVSVDDLKRPLSVLERCPSYREFSYSKMTGKWQGPTKGVRLIEVSVKRELTV